MANLTIISCNENVGFYNYLFPKKEKNKETVNSFTLLTHTNEIQMKRIVESGEKNWSQNGL
jgi:hypothetical protein